MIPIKEEPYKGDYEKECFYNIYRAELLSKRNDSTRNENSILEVLNINWQLLEKALKQQNDDIIIQIFINSIYNDLIHLILNSGNMQTIQQREEFENKINEIVKNGLQNYRKNSGKYQRVIETISTQNFLNNYLILENDKIMLDEAEKEYPYYYEFLSIPKVEENDLKEILKSQKDAKKKYPVLYNYLETNKENVEYLKTFPQINNFVNYTVEHYTNEISRNNAKLKKVSEEIDLKNIPESLFTEFLRGFNNSGIYKIADQYLCHRIDEKIRIRELTKNDSLSCFLIDNGVVDYGMQLAAIYQKYISFQNQFLNDVSSDIDDNSNQKLIYLKNKINEAINPQKANLINIVNFKIDTENFESFLEMILFYSYKDSFDQNYEYDFSKKDKIKYNLEEIEEQLENILLPGKKIFTDEIDFVIYQFEGFRQNSSILSGFMLKYQQITLDNEQRNFLYNFRNDQYSSETIIRILFSIQLMITFYNEQPEFIDKDMRISATFNNFPDFFRIPEDTKKLFRNYPFTISHIISVYEYFELLCFEEFKKDMDPLFKQKIDDEKMKVIENYFIKNPNVILNKLEISSACRKFISRNLIGIREDLTFDGNQELFFILKFKEDCWNTYLITNDSFEQEIQNLSSLDIKMAQILDLYEKLGGDKILLGDDIRIKVNEDEKINKVDKKKTKKKKDTKKQVF
jgi:hypothetical protein